jgi:hypothetical protein
MQAERGGSLTVIDYIFLMQVTYPVLCCLSVFLTATS